MNRTLTNIHLIAAAFFFPIALMFATTGGLYTLSVKGAYQDRTIDVAIDAPLQSELGPLVTLVESQLRAADVAPPSGGASIKKAGTSFELEWTGVERDVVLKPTDDPRVAKLTIKETGAWRHLVQLHKAKGSDIAKGISVAWAAGLIAILGTGLWMALRAPPYRRKALFAAAAGLVTFTAYATLG